MMKKTKVRVEAGVKGRPVTHLAIKAVVSDIDGTLLVEGQRFAPRVIEAIKACQLRGVPVGAVTARPLPYALPAIKLLGIKGLCAVANGAVLYDADKEEVVAEYVMREEVVRGVWELTRGMAAVRWILDDGRDCDGDDEAYVPHKPQLVVLGRVAVDRLDEVLHQIGIMDEVLASKGAVYEGNRLADIYISHPSATKQHAALAIAEGMGIEPGQMLGMGDGYNDFPLLMACGRRVAMGNAVEELKAIADWVAPTVWEDGAAVALEREVLGR